MSQEKDLSEKLLEDYNDVFSDIINVLLFDGHIVVHEDELENILPVSQYKAEAGKLHEEERDVAKRWKNNNIKLASIGLENQSHYYKYMPARVIGYDGAIYRGQLLNKPVKNIYPVITIVLNFSSRRWKKNKSLYDILKIPNGLKPYVNDYKIHVFDIAFLTDEQIKMFKSDFKIVAEYFVNRRKNKKFEFPKKLPKHVDEVLKMLTAITGDERFYESWNEVLSQTEDGEEINMGEKWIDDIENRGIKKGREEGRAEGRVEGRAEGRTEGRALAEEELKKAIELKEKGITDIKEYLKEGISQTIAALILGTQPTTVS